MCSKIFFCKSETFLFLQKYLGHLENILMCSKIFLAKTEHFYLTQIAIGSCFYLIATANEG
jgi:hypothetical protein